MGDESFRQFRVGAHASGFQLGGIQLGVSGGFATDGAKRSGAYGSIDVRAGF
jgi:hypothetical protein